MRSINATLTSEQKKHSVTPVVEVVIGATDVSAYLVAYTYRERANQMVFSEVVLDNSGGHFNSSPPALGDDVVITRGLKVSGTDYDDELPTLYVESLEYTSGLLIVTCLDFWGKLARYRREATWTRTADSAEDIIDYILDSVGLTHSGSITALTLNFTITRNGRHDQALRRVASKLPEYPYAGPGEVVKFKDLDSADSSDYTYGWQSDHPVREVRYTSAAWKYNRVFVIGGLDSDGAEYSDDVEDLTQRGLVGTRPLVLRDPLLSSDAECLQKATAELAYYEAAATQIELEALPCHGLELYDMITLASSPWGGSSVKVRVKSYIERYGPGLHQQEIQLLSPSSDVHIEPAELPDGLIEQDDEGSAKIGPAALSAYHTIGAVVRSTDKYSNFDTALKCRVCFLESTGRLPEFGDTMLVWNSTTSEFRLYVYESTGGNTWVYITMTGTVT